MIDTSIAKLTELFIHQVGSEENPQDIHLSNQPVYVYDDDMKSKLLQYFKVIYDENQTYAFINQGEGEIQNVMQRYCKTLFSQQEHLYFQTGQEIANHLAQQSYHPHIKSGQLIIAKINELIIDDEIVDAIAIVKSENKQNFFKTHVSNGRAHFEIDEGIHIRKIDKACLVIQTQEHDGYRMYIKDNSSKTDTTAVYWKTDFLNAGLKMDDYQYTEVYMQATEKFLNEFQSEEHPIDKEKELQIKNRSADYFNKSEEFNWDDYKESLFEGEEMQQEFEDYKNKITEYNNQSVPDSFSVSDKAVQKNSKYFRSVIKLDKNFHLYVHGKSDMIERGVDESGRKYYKLFYHEEH